MQPDSWALADEAQSIALGLPPRPEGYGLIMLMMDGERRVTWAGDRIAVAALEEREGDLTDWDRKDRFPLEADGWPSDQATMLWRTR